MGSLSRRDFLKGSAALAAAAGLGGAAGAQQQEARRGSANEQLRVAVIGVNGRGRDHIGGLAGRNNCVVTHICDVDRNCIGPAMQQAERQQGRRPEFVQDLRRVMDNNDIDIVSVATPNHWHSLAAIWALQAGKHVYVEKPVSHNVWEGRRLVEIQRQTGKLCQAGTQIRSNPGIREAIEFVRSGQLGRLRVARGLCYKPRDNSQGRVESVAQAPTPDGLNFDLWLGPAPTRPYHENLVHYRWHWYWDFGNGDLGNQGIHQMDVARWALGKNELARSVLSVGGRFGRPDRGETPNTQVAVFDYGDCELIFEVRGLRTNDYRGARVGNVFHCENGYVAITSYDTAVACNNDGEVIRQFRGSGNHYTNFVNAVRNNRREDLNGEILEGHLSSALCHLANISHRLGTPTPFNRRTEVFGDDREASETLARTREHLGENMVPMDEATYILGRRLTLDPGSERFVNDEQANRHLTREYRRGFEVPART